MSGAKEVAIEFSSLSKTYSMAGWRIGFAVGNKRLTAALSRVKSYLDYGAFTPSRWRRRRRSTGRKPASTRCAGATGSAATR